ncbi:MFS transporter [Izhakiella australiensis]|uniref:MFS transporter n=1 Tax=Izhakiella australiensis TaxID=1926881 RepID=A0A1S8YT83_9GAMM|nr:MFS transporter [Izhakiella australiensis]OON41853.1 MFS transporter [Izhakiella australiensis]
MIQIAMLLLGTKYIKRNARYLSIAGGLWFVAGVLLFIDGLDQHSYFPLKIFGYILMVESVITLSVASNGVGTKKSILFFKGGIFLFVALIILVNQKYSNVLLAIIFGFTFFIIGFFTSFSSFIVRFPRWKLTLAYGLVLIAFSFFLLLHHAATVSFFIGFQMISSGLSSIGIARKAMRMKSGTSIFQLIQPGDVLLSSVPLKHDAKPVAKPADAKSAPPASLVVHVWTPEESAEARPISRPVINRYIAAVDENGVISTGHAALEVPGHLYISLYPAEDIDRSPSEFLRTLKATHENDVSGRFLPDYATESREWCDSVRKIVFDNFSAHKLNNFWETYRQNETYNLTYRNCSSSVAYALEAALDGVLAQNKKFGYLLKILLVPELWIAAQVRKRAQMMAWTPGLVMDYSRALYALVHPLPRPWYRRLPWSSARKK